MDLNCDIKQNTIYTTFSMYNKIENANLAMNKGMEIEENENI